MPCPRLPWACGCRQLHAHGKRGHGTQRAVRQFIFHRSYFIILSHALHRHHEPEGRGGKDNHRGESVRRAGRHRAPGVPAGPRSPGPRHAALRHRAKARRTLHLPRADRQDAHRRSVPAGGRESVDRAVEPGPDGGGTGTGRRDRPRGDPPRQAPRRPAAGRLSA